jgi:hypothetical protein
MTPPGPVRIPVYPRQSGRRVGYYHLVSFLLNALGVPLEPAAKPFPGA